LKPIATLEDIQALGHIYDVEKQVPFLGPILKVIDEEVVIVVMMRMVIMMIIVMRLIKIEIILLMMTMVIQGNQRY